MSPRAWYHTIDLPGGRTTPGWFDTRSSPAKVPWPAHLGRCLDVGTFDGFWAFEMERRGATEVVAIDLDDPFQLDWPYDLRLSGPAQIAEWGSGRGPGFAEAAAALSSDVKRRSRSVYDLDPDADGRFDTVLCGALLLHLRDPVLGLERMRSVCTGSLVLVESVDPRLELVARRCPSAQFHPEPDEWWRVNSAGLIKLVESAGFRVAQVSERFLVPHGPGAAPDHRLSSLAGVLAGRPGRRGLLTRALRAEPRPARG
ncbi:MAG TPA: class I SAM-dependent methyltransferase [Acidimicrobiales bacterium]|nr:class I SAM-dependent methyltransferase [Acidimicrobiales bacterium]